MNLLIRRPGINRKKEQSAEQSAKKVKFCPLCSAPLKQGENLKSVVYPGSEETMDKITEIYGCPYCYPANKKNIRICPVCKKPMSDDGFIIARMFDKSPRIHVHVLGCTNCYRRH